MGWCENFLKKVFTLSKTFEIKVLPPAATKQPKEIGASL
jgi:hypothetical protein